MAVAPAQPRPAVVRACVQPCVRATVRACYHVYVLCVCCMHQNAVPLVTVPLQCLAGASSDLDQATRIANAMVTRYGMNSKVT